ncbi:hypothetical protein [Marinobacterium alkalitolerans]|uniref:hypothetical protein n=1 Tax=Marinobacterium alkalitolerans TaxID=1542925 RepID=UPI001F2F7210|nr:hypothetical protein [Marinobacterium alkalitolerans]
MSLIIGIDPDSKKSGIGIVQNGQLIDLKTMNFFDLQEWTEEQHAAGAHFAVEDVQANKATYARNIKRGSRQKEQAQMNCISQKVGRVKHSGELIVMWLDRIGASYTLVKPLGGTAKAAKRKADLFKKMTGWEGRSNEDTRDAAMLALSVARRQQRAKA